MLKQRVTKFAAAVVVAIVLIVGGANSAMAHHGWSEYNNSQTLNFTGEIQSIGYDYPHVVIQLAADDQVWQAVLAPPSRMQSRGLPQEALQVGQSVSLVGYPHRSETNELRAERITVNDQTVELR